MQKNHQQIIDIDFIYKNKNAKKNNLSKEELMTTIFNELHNDLYYAQNILTYDARFNMEFYNKTYNYNFTKYTQAYCDWKKN